MVDEADGVPVCSLNHGALRRTHRWSAATRPTRVLGERDRRLRIRNGPLAVATTVEALNFCVLQKDYIHPRVMRAVPTDASNMGASIHWFEHVANGTWCRCICGGAILATHCGQTDERCESRKEELDMCQSQRPVPRRPGLKEILCRRFAAAAERSRGGGLHHG